MTNDKIKDFLKADIGFYADMLIYNEEWLSHYILRRSELKAKLDLLEKQLHDHLKNLEEFEVK